MNARKEPTWCADALRRIRLADELEQYKADVEKLTRVAESNMRLAEEVGGCIPEPRVKTPPLVRQLADEWPELNAAIDACRPLESFDDVLQDLYGGPTLARAAPDPDRDRDHIRKLTESSKDLLSVVSECCDCFGKAGRESGGLSKDEIRQRALGVLADAERGPRPIRSRNELARKVRCSPNAKALVEVWDRWKAVQGSGAAPKATRFHEGIGRADEELERLVEEQEVDMQSDGYSRRAKV